MGTRSILLALFLTSAFSCSSAPGDSAETRSAPLENKIRTDTRAEARNEADAQKSISIPGDLLIVKVSAGKEVTFLGRTVGIEDFGAALAELNVPHDISVEIDAGSDVPMQRVVAILDHLIKYGFTEVNFAGAQSVEDESEEK